MRGQISDDSPADSDSIGQKAAGIWTAQTDLQPILHKPDRLLMAGLDTNVLVRWLVDDDAGQSRRIAEMLESAARRDETLFVPLTVMLELEWVLRSRYTLTKPDILLALNALLETRELEFQTEPAIERALHAYRQGTADFADCLHAAACWVEGKAPMLTLDAKAARLADAKLLTG